MSPGWGFHLTIIMLICMSTYMIYCLVNFLGRLYFSKKNLSKLTYLWKECCISFYIIIHWKFCSSTLGYHILVVYINHHSLHFLSCFCMWLIITSLSVGSAFLLLLILNCVKCASAMSPMSEPLSYQYKFLLDWKQDTWTKIGNGGSAMFVDTSSKICMWYSILFKPLDLTCSTKYTILFLAIK